ncbi:unnamed protein product [Rhizophagus irregularis]|nr:unnamed protein product [Rhizophagus irregularis]
MRRGWIDRKEVSVTLPNIFDEIVPCIRKIDTANFVVVDKPEYYLVLGNVWLMHTGYAVDRHHQYTLINLKRSKNKKGKKDNIAVESECSSSEDESEDEEGRSTCEKQDIKHVGYFYSYHSHVIMQ